MHTLGPLVIFLLVAISNALFYPNMRPMFDDYGTLQKRSPVEKYIYEKREFNPADLTLRFGKRSSASSFRPEDLNLRFGKRSAFSSDDIALRFGKREYGFSPDDLSLRFGKRASDIQKKFSPDDLNLRFGRK